MKEVQFIDAKTRGLDGLTRKQIKKRLGKQVLLLGKMEESGTLVVKLNVRQRPAKRPRWSRPHTRRFTLRDRSRAPVFVGSTVPRPRTRPKGPLRRSSSGRPVRA